MSAYALTSSGICRVVILIQRENPGLEGLLKKSVYEPNSYNANAIMDKKKSDLNNTCIGQMVLRIVLLQVALVIVSVLASRTLLCIYPVTCVVRNPDSSFKSGTSSNMDGHLRAISTSAKYVFAAVHGTVLGSSLTAEIMCVERSSLHGE